MSTRSPLTIKRVDPIAVALPLIKPMTLARTRLTKTTNMLVRIEAKNGAVGWGETATMPARTGEDLAMVSRALSKIGPHLVGKDAGDHAMLIAALARRAGQSHAALCAVDMALHDLVGQASNLPVSSLLGGSVRDRVATIWLLGGETVEADLAEAARQQRRGYAEFKIKVGAKPLAETIATLNALRRKLGPRAKLSADANMALSPREAAQFLRGVSRASLLYFEQPFAPDAVRAMAKLARSSAIPLGIDESVGSAADIVAHHVAGAAKGVALKSITLGSLPATIAAAAVADALGMAVNISSKIAESSIGAAALLQVASVAANIDWGVSPTNCYIAEDVVRKPFVLARGRMAVPNGPGLGIEVDTAAVSRFRLR